MNSLDFQLMVEKLYREREYRPEGAAILYRRPELECSLKSEPGREPKCRLSSVSSEITSPEITYLIVQSAKSAYSWHFPQGGIKPDESAEKNLARELREELGIKFKSEISDLVLTFHYEQLDAVPGRKLREGFTKGKAFFFSVGRYSWNNKYKQGKFKLQPKEVADAQWLSYEQALEKFALGRPEKAALLTRSLNKAIELISSF